MHLLADTTVDIACPPQRAFDFAANLENFPHWFPGALSITSENALPFNTVGKQYRETVVLPLRGQRSVHIRVIEVAAPARLVTEGSMALLLPRMEMAFDPHGPDACRLRWRMWSRQTAALPRWTVLPLARITMSRRAAAGLRRLRHLLEQRDAGSASIA